MAIRRNSPMPPISNRRMPVPMCTSSNPVMKVFSYTLKNSMAFPSYHPCNFISICSAIRPAARKQRTICGLPCSFPTMPPPTEQVQATRVLLHDVCALLAQQGDDAVLIGGWVPDVRFPAARPAHIGSIDVDMALCLQRAAHEAVVALLLKNGFRPGQHRYQFLKDVSLGDGRTFPARLDLLT